VTPPAPVDPAESRAGLYELLARLTLNEVDETLASLLLTMPALGDALVASGGTSALQALRADYTQAFVMNLSPYESAYLDESGLLNTAQSEAVLREFETFGFEPETPRGTAAPDHLGLELALMGQLARREAAARRDANRAVVNALRIAQRRFLEQHLLAWGPVFGQALAETASLPFYRALGGLIEELLLEDFEQLSAPSNDG
jgi:TorA maturation chaperone TorD